jgi:hypothetical protein
MTRRGLMAGAMSAGVGLAVAGCTARLHPLLARSPATELVISDDFLAVNRSAIIRAWSKAHRGTLKIYPTSFSTTPSGLKGTDVAPASITAGGAVVGNASLSTTSAAPLDAYLRKANLDPSSLLPGSLAAFQDVNGVTLALPVYVGEYQLYVDRSRAPVGGSIGPWTFATMSAFLSSSAHAPTGTAAQRIVGNGWVQMLNFLPALMIGWSNNVFTQDGGFSVAGMQPCLETLIPFARQNGWKPNLGAPLPGSYIFLSDGFKGTPDAVFAFDAPWTSFATPSFSKAIHAGTIVATPFPMLPRGAIVPAVPPAGLAVPAMSKARDGAAAFILWLLEPQQQELLVSLGQPPVLQSDTLQSAWSTEAASGKWPLFLQSGYTDVTSQTLRARVARPSSGGGAAAWPYIVSAVEEMYATGDVAGTLATLEGILDA